MLILRSRDPAVAATFALGVAFTTVPAHAQTSNSVTVTGTLIEGGVICRAMRGDDSVLYTLLRTAAVRELQTGDRLRVEGRIAELSICQQGTTIEIMRLEKVP
jgi:hypothetical protein